MKSVSLTLLQKRRGDSRIKKTKKKPPKKLR